MRIVIASNDRNVFTLLDQYLEQSGHELVAAEVGPGMVGFIRSVRPEVVVLHAVAADAEELELCRAIKADPATAACKMILVGNRVDPAAIIKGYSSGVDYILAYPFKLSDLRAVLESYASPVRDGQWNRVTGA